MDDNLISIDDYQVVDVHFRGGPLDGDVIREGLLEHFGIKPQPMEIALCVDNPAFGPGLVVGDVRTCKYGPVMFDEDKDEYYRECWDG